MRTILPILCFISFSSLAHGGQRCVAPIAGAYGSLPADGICRIISTKSECEKSMCKWEVDNQATFEAKDVSDKPTPVVSKDPCDALGDIKMATVRYTTVNGQGQSHSRGAAEQTAISNCSIDLRDGTLKGVKLTPEQQRGTCAVVNVSQYTNSGLPSYIAAAAIKYEVPLTTWELWIARCEKLLKCQASAIVDDTKTTFFLDKLDKVIKQNACF